MWKLWLNLPVMLTISDFITMDIVIISQGLREFYEIGNYLIVCCLS